MRKLLFVRVGPVRDLIEGGRYFCTFEALKKILRAIVSKMLLEIKIAESIRDAVL